MSATIRYARPSVLDDMPVRAHFAIEASAGTGKTYLIEHRVVDLIIRGGVPVDDILVVTFTEKATAELKQRVRRKLEAIVLCREDSAAADEPCWLIDDEARERVEGALSGFDRVAISTIHGFCHRLVGEHAFAGGKQLRQQQVADVTAFEDAFRAEMRERFANHDDYRPYLEQWLGRGKAIAELGKLLYQCSRERAPIEPLLDETALNRAAQAARTAAADVLPSAAERLRGASVHHSTTRAIVRRLTALVELVSSATGQAARMCAELEALKLAELADKLGSTGIAPALAHAITDLDAAAPSLAAAIASRFVPVIRDRLGHDKHEHGLFDFDDMLTQLWATLSGPSGNALAEDLRQRYPFALIDEFQDTDELQWKIFRAIYLEGDDAYLSIIGDPKQAIYGFRGADVYTYLRARDELCARGGHLIRLADNYRSSAPLVSAYNTLFADFFTEGIDYEHVNACADVEAFDDATLAAPFVVLEIGGDTKLSAHALRAAAKVALVDELQATLGDNRLLVAEGGAKRRVGPGDCFVLTRSTAEAFEIADELRARAIPCALFQHEGLLSSQECLEIRDLLAAVANPDDRSARLRAWRTRFFAVDLGELAEIGPLEDSHPLVTRLYDWNELADRFDYERLFPAIIDDSGVLERELMLASSERALTNFLHLCELLLEDVVSSRCDIHELVTRLDRWMADAELVPGQDRNLQRLESDREAVQIMTVHKSKGLEAPIVFLYGGFGAGGGDRVNIHHDQGERRVHVGPMSTALKQRVAAETRAENERLLYVAITRAAVRVVLPFVDAGIAPRLGGYYALLHERLELLLSSNASGFQSRPAALGGALAGAAVDIDALASSLSIPSAGAAARTLARRRRGFVVTSYTRLKQENERLDDDRAVSFDHGVELPEGALPGGAESGILVHEVLETIDFESVARAETFESWARESDSRPAIEAALRRHGISKVYLASVQDMVWRALMTPVVIGEGPGAAISSAKRFQRELEFLYPLPTRGAGYVRGFIDLLVEIDDRYYVLDWKTDVLPDYSPGALDAHVDNYRIQVELYSVALDRLLNRDDKRFGGLLYIFVRGFEHTADGVRGVYFVRPSRGDLDRSYQRLEGVGRG